MRKMPQRGRVTKFGEPLNQRLVVNFTATQVEQLNAAIDGGDMGAFIRDATLRALGGALPDAAENRVTFDVTPDNRAALQKLADGLYMGDVDMVARVVALRLAEMEIEDVREVLLGDAKRALQKKIGKPDIAPKNDAAKSNKTNASKMVA